MASTCNVWFLSGGGELGALIEADWSSTSLGPLETWPAALKTTTAMLLRSRVPIVLLWGEDGVMLYNDAYSVFAGGRHPDLLGSKVRERWPEVARDIQNFKKQVVFRHQGGPRLRLAPQADPGDGLFDVVALEPSRRKEMLRWLKSGDADEPPPFTTRRGRKITLAWEGTPLHVDDDIPPPEECAATVELEVEQDGVSILVAPTSGCPGEVRAWCSWRRAHHRVRLSYAQPPPRIGERPRRTLRDARISSLPRSAYFAGAWDY